MAHSGTALGMLDGPERADPGVVLFGLGSACCVDTLLIGLMRLPGLGGCWTWLVCGAPGHGPLHLLVRSAAKIGFRWCSGGFCWDRPGLRDPFWECLGWFSPWQGAGGKRSVLFFVGVRMGGSFVLEMFLSLLMSTHGSPELHGIVDMDKFGWPGCLL